MLNDRKLTIFIKEKIVKFCYIFANICIYIQNFEPSK